MRKALPWIFGILFGLIILALVLFGRSERQAYRAARGAIQQRVATTQERIDVAVENATAAVDLALTMAGDLPSQQAQADLIKQDIEEIGNRLKEAAEATGDEAIAKLDASIEQFNTTLETIDEASQNAESPQVQSTLDRIYGILLAVKEQLVEGILQNQE